MDRLEEIRKKAWSARARATSSTGWMMAYALDVEYLLELIDAKEPDS